MITQNFLLISSNVFGFYVPRFSRHGVQTVTKKVGNFSLKCLLSMRETFGTKVHTSAVRSHLIRSLTGCVAAEKAFLRKGNKQKRLPYMKFHKAWSDNQRKKVSEVCSLPEDKVLARSQSGLLSWGSGQN